jgi:hypothetical protein
MNKAERTAAIHAIVKGKNYASTGKRLRYEGNTLTFKEYEIPIEYLIYNVENGRIASLVKSFEREHGVLDPEKPEDAARIAEFLYESNNIANKKTIEDIAENGQLESGIITSDGVIVDGNRRASLMLQILNSDEFTPEQKSRCRKFRTVVLPEEADDKEILRLETSYQMGTDEKVAYNPIEKYLHARDMKEKGFELRDIEKYMGLKNESEVHILLEVMELIDDYLNYFDYDGIYTRLPRGFEDDLLKLNGAIKKIRRGNISWIPENELELVETDLRGISFDFIRLDPSENGIFSYRAIASTANDNFLLDENVWKKFVEDWREATCNVEEEPIDKTLESSTSLADSKRLLNQRDNKWKDAVRDKLMDGFANAKNIIENKKETNKPSVLLRKAINALTAVNTDVVKCVIDKNDIKSQLNQIIQLCDNIEKGLQ